MFVCSSVSDCARARCSYAVLYVILFLGFLFAMGCFMVYLHRRQINLKVHAVCPARQEYHCVIQVLGLPCVRCDLVARMGFD